MITTAQYRKAGQVLGGATANRSGNPSAHGLSAVASVGLEWLTNPVGIAELIPDAIGVLTAWIASHIGPVQEAVDQLAGDGAAILEHSAAWYRTADQLEQHAVETRAALDGVDDWEGEASRAFAEHIHAEIGVALAAAEVWRTLASRAVELGEYVANARKAIVAIAGNLISDLIQGAIAMGPALIAGATLAAIPVVGVAAAAGAAGLAAPFVAWAADLVANEIRHISLLLQDVLAQGSELLGQLAGLGEDLGRAASILHTGKDPGPLGQVSGAGLDIQGSAQPDRDFSLLLLNNAIPDETPEDPIDNPVSDGFEMVSPEELRAMGVDPALLVNEETGFGAHVVRDPSGRLAVVFDGTDFANPRDVAEDGAGVAQLTGQSLDAARLAEAMARSSEADNVVYTGFSLGGRLAAVASMATGVGAVTFNAAGVSPATIDYFAARHGVDPTEYRRQLQNGQVRLYTTADDPLTNIQENIPTTAVTAPDAIGRQYRLGGDKLDPVEGHLTPNIVEQFKRRRNSLGDGDTSLNPEFH